MINIEKIKNSKTTEELLEFGIINIDKSSGPTSFGVSNFIKKKLNARKTSHFGTLDPKVTGVLPVAINRACKLAGFFLGEDKEYIGIAQFHEEISKEKIEKKIKEKFLGEIIQLPPIKSRVKRQERPRTIYTFEILEKEGKNFLFKTKCQGGTYVRKLISDLGDELGISAHMLELRRISAGIFSEEKIYNLYDFEKAVDQYKNGNDKSLREMLIPGEIVSELFPLVKIVPGSLKKIYHGSPIHDDELENKKDKSLEKDKIICVFSKDQFVGIFKIIKQGNLFARSEFTLQPIG